MKTEWWLGVLLMLALVVAPRAGLASEPLLLECGDCSSEETARLLQLTGDGERYLIDLQGRSIRKFLVPGTPHVAQGMDGEPSRLDPETADRLLAGIAVTEQLVEPPIDRLYRDLQLLHDTDPSALQPLTLAAPIEGLGTNPATSRPFDPFEIGHWGPGHAEADGFLERMAQVLQSEAWTREAVSGQLALALFQARDRIAAAGLTLGPVGDRIGWIAAGPWTVSMCDAGGLCAQVRIRSDREIEYTGSFDAVNNAVPARQGIGHAGMYPPGTSAAAVLAGLQRHGVPVVAQAATCVGSLMLICEYPDGTLSTCRTETRCD